MEINGIEKEVDLLGRVVIPIKFRKKLGLEAGAKVFVSMEENLIKISPKDRRCALCGDIIEEKQKFRLCNGCVSKIKSE